MNLDIIAGAPVDEWLQNYLKVQVLFWVFILLNENVFIYIKTFGIIGIIFVSILYCMIILIISLVSFP